MRLLYPPKPVAAILPTVVFGLLIFIFVTGRTQSPAAYVIYVLSAYSLTVWVAVTPKFIKGCKRAFMQSRAMVRLSGTAFGKKYLGDLAFRGSVSIYSGMAVNFFYVIFRIAVGIVYASVWFISMAAYYLVLGALRLYLIVNYRRCKISPSAVRELKCYRRAAWMLFLLNIPMGGMILLMVVKNSGYTYPGYVIYISAAYTFYTAIRSVVDLVKFRRLGSPVLSAAKVLNFVAAMMSLLGLQTAMIARFNAKENGEAFRRLMNSLTGSAVWLIVIVTAVYMLVHSSRVQKSQG